MLSKVQVFKNSYSSSSKLAELVVWLELFVWLLSNFRNSLRFLFSFSIFPTGGRAPEFCSESRYKKFLFHFPVDPKPPLRIPTCGLVGVLTFFISLGDIIVRGEMLIFIITNWAIRSFFFMLIG